MNKRISLGIIVLAMAVSYTNAYSISVDEFINNTKTEQQNQEVFDKELYSRLLQAGCIDGLEGIMLTSEQIQALAKGCIAEGKLN